jgi:hypothetical protein
MTGDRPRGDSIVAEPESLCHPRSVTSNCLVRRNGLDSHASRIIRIAHVIHDSHDYPNGTIWGHNNNDEA